MVKYVYKKKGKNYVMNEKEKLKLLIDEYDETVAAYKKFCFFYIQKQTEAIEDRFHDAFPDIKENYVDIVSEGSKNEHYDDVMSWLSEQDNYLQNLRQNIYQNHKEEHEKLKENRSKAADKILATTYAQQILKVNDKILLQFLASFQENNNDYFTQKDCFILFIKKNI